MAAADYLRQFYGAAQIQVVFDPQEMQAKEQDEVFAQLLGANLDVLDALVLKK
jgi:hypothetical protein